MEEEKFGKILVDGELVDLDNAPLDKLFELQDKVIKKEEEITKRIDRILEDDEIDKELEELNELEHAEDEER